MSVEHPIVAFLTALRARMMAISCLSEVWTEPRFTKDISSDYGCCADIFVAGESSRHRLHVAVDRLVDVGIRVYAPRYSTVLTCTEYIQDAIYTDVTIGGACLKCVFYFRDPPRPMTSQGRSYIQDSVYRVELRRLF